MITRIGAFCALLCVLATSTGCATYWRDRARDAQDIFSLRAGRITGLRVQAGPAAVAAIKERIPGDFALGREHVRKQRMAECARLWDVKIPEPYTLPDSSHKSFSAQLSIPYRRHWWKVEGSANRKMIGEITQREVNDYHRARTMDDLFHFVWESEAPFCPDRDPPGTYHYGELGLRLKTRPMTDIGAEIGIYYGVSLRVNVMEVLDFILGFVKIDILHDDIPSITPENIRGKFDVKRSRFY